MAGWRLRMAIGLTGLSLFVWSPSSIRAGNFCDRLPKKSARPKVLPCDCQFGFYGTGWRAWPEGCNDWPNNAEQPMPFTGSFAAPFAPPANGWLPPWNGPQTVAPPPPSPWSTYRDFLGPQSPASGRALPPSALPQHSYPIEGLPPSAGPIPQAPFAAPQVPSSIDPPSVLPAPVRPQSAPMAPMLEPKPPLPSVPSDPQATRNFVPPLPTTMTPARRTTAAQDFVPVAAWTQPNGSRSVVTLGTPISQPEANRDTSSSKPLMKSPTASSVPRTLIAPAPGPATSMPRAASPVTLLPPQAP